MYILHIYIEVYIYIYMGMMNINHVGSYKPYNKPMVYDQWYISTNGIKSWDGEIWT